MNAITNAAKVGRTNRGKYLGRFFFIAKSPFGNVDKCQLSAELSFSHEVITVSRTYSQSLLP